MKSLLDMLAGMTDVEVRTADAAIAVGDIMGFCRRQLSSYKVPASIDLVTGIELTPGGKVRHG